MILGFFYQPTSKFSKYRYLLTEMLQPINHHWRRLMLMGNENLTSKAHLTLGKIFNILLFILVVSSTASLFNEIINGHFYGSIINGIVCSFIIFIFLLKIRGNLWTSSLLFNLVLPLGVVGICFLYNDVKFTSFYFMTFTMFGILYSKSNWLKYFFVIYFATLFIVVSWLQYSVPPLMGKEFNEISNIGLFLNFSLFFLILIFQIVNKLIQSGVEIDELNQKLKLQNENLNNKNDELNKYNQLVSHDLKTPLRNIGNFVGLIERRINEGKEENIQSYFTHVKDGVFQMEKLINQSLSFTKIDDAKNLEMEEINLSQLVHCIEKDLGAQYCNFQIQAKNLPIIWGNFMIYKKVFQNLIENGIKYNNSSKKIIKIQAHSSDLNMKYVFEDNGIGIPTSEIDKIFDMYNRGSVNTEFEGTGLGLSISQKLVESLGGYIEVWSEEGKGSKFHVILPLADSVPV